MKNMKRQSKKCTTNMTCTATTPPSNAPKDSRNESQGMIFSKTFIDKDEYNIVTKLCNIKVIFGRFRIWMNKEMDSTLQKLQHGLFLLDQLLAITPKREEQPKIAYDTEQSKAPVQNMQAEFEDHDSINLTQEDLRYTTNARVLKQKPNQNEERGNNKNNN